MGFVPDQELGFGGFRVCGTFAGGMVLDALGEIVCQADIVGAVYAN